VWAPAGSDHPVMWPGEGYLISNFTYLVEDLPAATGAPLVEVAERIYYSRDDYPSTS
jgi:hypothetical protein